jgi:hypothetical protein
MPPYVGNFNEIFDKRLHIDCWNVYHLLVEHQSCSINHLAGVQGWTSNFIVVGVLIVKDGNLRMVSSHSLRDGG